MLLRWEVCEKCVSQHGILSVFKVHLEEVMFRVSRQTRVRVGRGTVSKTGDGSQSAVLDTHTLNLEVCFPAWEFLGRRGAVVGSICAVYEEDNIGIKREDFTDRRNSAIEAGENTQVLIGVLVTIAPGTPIDAFPPVLLDTCGGGEDVTHAGCKDDFPCGEGDGFVAGVVGEDFERGVVVLGLNGCDGAVDEVDSTIITDLLAGCETEPGGCYTVKAEDIVRMAGRVVAI